MTVQRFFNKNVEKLKKTLKTRFIKIKTFINVYYNCALH